MKDGGISRPSSKQEENQRKKMPGVMEIPGVFFVRIRMDGLCQRPRCMENGAGDGVRLLHTERKDQRRISLCQKLLIIPWILLTSASGS